MAYSDAASESAVTPDTCRPPCRRAIARTRRMTASRSARGAGRRVPAAATTLSSSLQIVPT